MARRLFHMTGCPIKDNPYAKTCDCMRLRILFDRTLNSTPPPAATGAMSREEAVKLLTELRTEQETLLQIISRRRKQRANEKMLERRLIALDVALTTLKLQTLENENATLHFHTAPSL